MSRRWIALWVVCLGQLMSLLDSTIVEVALPDIQHDLAFTQSNLTWVLNGYLVTLGSLLLFGGRLGDLIGRRRVFLAGVTTFTISSLICGLAETQNVLIAARFVQGVGGAGAVSVSVGIITATFPEPAERARAMSVFTFVAAGGSSVGLILGGVITQLLDWHWIFFVNVPLGCLAVALGRVFVEENEGPGVDRHVDVPGAVLITAAFAMLAVAIASAGSHGWGSVQTLGGGGLAVLLAGAFAVVEARAARPLMPLRVLRLPGLVAASLLRGLFIGTVYGVFFVGVLYLERVLGYSALATGLAFLPQTAVLAALSLGVSASLIGRFGPRPPTVVGLALAIAGFALLSQAGTATAYLPLIVCSLLLIGSGVGIGSVPLLAIATARVPREDAGLSSGIVNTAVQVFQAVGTAVLGTLAATHAQGLLTKGRPVREALTGGYRLTFACGAGGVLLVLLGTAAWWSLDRMRSPARERTSA